MQADFLSAIDESRATRIVDLCSGGGGPWLSPGWRAALATRAPLTCLLTDKFPSRALSARLRSDPLLSCVDEPVDAACVPENLRGFRTIFSSFHHFPDRVAREVLADAVRCGDGFAMAEVTSRTWRGFAIVAVLPVLVWLLTPGMRPFRWSRLLFTYVIPLIPAVVLWDGWVSCFRTRTPRELVALTAGFPYYQWAAGYARRPWAWLVPVYLIGRPQP